ncbi:antibiotic biosynthesis monooxygenase [Sphaerisporangium sp. TRM90804]|uniref:antibiotic biosynthesis monooxygenase family protein n=1 Tax=Sphaerisporangium sp. TRM90804 TaxID=3031113 RepID=UPI0024480995|nr:antibiotic biosynthesis monooxygenase [Sphaerisporangium sp. TRM90804]MDH2429194.1 antibiotic biosynthesis monooxygenase [Sphaerisporangium sp. TRM90804]
MIAFINTFTLRGDRSLFERQVKEHEDFLRGQPGFGGFELTRSDLRPDEYIIVIQWRDAASHRRLMSVREFQIQVTGLLMIADVSCSPVDPNVAKADLARVV